MRRTHRAVFLNVPKIHVSGRYQPQKVWVGPSRKHNLDFLNDIDIATGRPQEFGDGSDAPKILRDKPYAYLSENSLIYHYNYIWITL